MSPHPVAFGGGSTQTVLGPAVLVCMLVAIVLMLVLPRKYVVIPFFIALFLCPAGQNFYLGGIHLFVTRFLIFAGWIRLMASKVSGHKLWAGFTSLDKVFLGWAIFRAFAFLVRFPDTGAFIYQGGFLIDYIGGFFLIRALIRDEEDIERIIKLLVGIAVVLAITMTYEEFTAVNLFGIIGHAPIIPQFRNGHVRALGPFEHPLLAGAFAATLLPLFFWLWKGGKSKVLAAVGILAITIATIMTQCSTPILAYGAAVFALCFWYFRKQMRLVRWGIVAGIIALQMVMKANFWWAIQHLDVVGGSSGWHRAELVDLFLRDFPHWWLVGTAHNASWGFMSWDLLNQYVKEGEEGGLLTFVLFIAMICICFRWLGNRRKSVEGDSQKEWYVWIFAAALFAHVIGYFGVSYFDQTRFAWMALLAMISVVAAPVRAAEKVPQEAAVLPVVPRPWLPAAEKAPQLGYSSASGRVGEAKSRLR